MNKKNFEKFFPRVNSILYMRINIKPPSAAPLFSAKLLLKTWLECSNNVTLQKETNKAGIWILKSRCSMQKTMQQYYSKPI
jgi:hypothetical protein